MRIMTARVLDAGWAEGKSDEEISKAYEERTDYFVQKYNESPMSSKAD
jgi:hypothetical protein